VINFLYNLKYTLIYILEFDLFISLPNNVPARSISNLARILSLIAIRQWRASEVYMYVGKIVTPGNKYRHRARTITFVSILCLIAHLYLIRDYCFILD
jgi:hypothetical protein